MIFHLKQRQCFLHDKTHAPVFDQEDVGGDSSAEGSEPDVTPRHEPITAQNIKNGRSVFVSVAHEDSAVA
jgi:hypothetical protein